MQPELHFPRFVWITVCSPARSRLAVRRDGVSHMMVAAGRYLIRLYAFGFLIEMYGFQCSVPAGGG